ncbi:hypothetical protein THI_0512 [Thiomonas arsenitoxydans]|uniref:Uncharacterized protein n=2 Tax=Thiomonas arsenitoxydans (strain DSM 22701 / CIP 110005 / 3As) TaxID=426114 RepID=D6CRL4_THIA3|nr:hypothetical protein THI_0512 [Thiomonas arsenitoxydans]
MSSLLQFMELLQRLEPDVLSERRALQQRLIDRARTAAEVWAEPGADLQTTGVAWNLARCAGLQVDRPHGADDMVARLRRPGIRAAAAHAAGLDELGRRASARA